MGLSNNFKYCAILVLVLFTNVPSQATVNPRNTGKSTTENNISEEQIPVREQDQRTEKEEVAESIEPREEVGSGNSNSSLNYFFYMIIKVKFENLFKFPDRNAPPKSTGMIININQVDGYFSNPRI